MNKKKQKSIKKIHLVVLTLLLTGVLSGCNAKTVSDSADKTMDSKAIAQSTEDSKESGVSTETDSTTTKIVEGGELVIAMTNEPTSFDPFISQGADTRSILFNIYEGLVKPTTDGGFVPAVAENYKVSEDARTYSFVLRNGIKFHNGNLVTADDVIYSINQAISAKVSGYDNIASTEAADSKTILIHLKEMDNDFLPYMTTAIVPKDSTDLETKPIGTGPYKLESFTEQQSLKLVKNSDYWQEGIPHLNKVTYKSVADNTAALLEFQAGTIDLLSVEYFSALQQLDSKEYTIEETPSNSVQLLALNNTYEPLKDIRVRQAISYVVDAQEIIQTVNKGYAKRAGSPVIPAFSKIYDTSLDNAYSKNVDKAKQLMNEAGYATGFSLKITVPSVYQVHIDTAQVIVNQLKQIGINATIESVDWSTWLNNVYTERQYEATIISVDGPNISAKSYLGRYLSTADNNFVNYSSADYDNTYNSAVKEPDETKRSKLYKQAQDILSKDAASVYIEDISRLYAFRKGFTGIVNYPLYVLDLSAIYKTE